MSVYILATLDTKGREAAFVRDQLAALGVAAKLVDTGCLGEPVVAADVPREQVFAAAGTTYQEILARRDRGEAVAAAAAGAARLVTDWHAADLLTGVIGLGGSAGTTIGTAAMRALPIGVPKLMVSTHASGQTRPYVGDKDVMMLYPIVDVSGINRISRLVLTNAARAMAGMTSLGTAPVAAPDDRPLVAASMFGVTTPCVERARALLEAAGCEVLVFHATGAGGKAMESLIAEGLIAGVLDVTTTELADEAFGGILSAGPERLTVAGKLGVPQVISVGALDMINFGAPETVPAKFKDRRFYHHNSTVTLMRTTPDENAALGEELATKAAAATGPTKIVLPLQGVSAIDRDGQPFDDPAARATLFDAIRRRSPAGLVVERDEHINDPAFADALAA
ncbi:MAG TPA: Tm-1-like ATP-binding domain-containing protein, partial [Pirellulales bacterium]